MKYIKIRAATYNKAMEKLRIEHGDDAIPISHKYVKEGGLFKSKLFAKEVVELTAAVQERKTARLLAEKKKLDITIGKTNEHKPVLEENKETIQDNNDDTIQSINKRIEDFNASFNNIQSTFEKKKDALPTKPVEKTETAQVIQKKETEQIKNTSITTDLPSEKFHKEFSEIKSVLNKLMKDKHSIESEMSIEPQEGEELKSYFTMLKDNDFDYDDCKLMISEVKKSISEEDLKDKFKIEKNLKDQLKSKVLTTGPLKVSNQKKIVMFIGPTGVGKTTTMAKLGAIHALREGSKVVFITLDNYRIAATEQLKKYAEIMRIPVHACNDQKDFKDIITKEKADIIMVDTSGRSHKNELKLSEIKSFADMVEYDFEKILCVSANTKKRDIIEIFKAFDMMEFNSIIITKVDETSFVGNVVDVADKYNKPISYFSNGQEVPNDIIVADPDKIVDLMIGEGNVS